MLSVSQPHFPYFAAFMTKREKIPLGREGVVEIQPHSSQSRRLPKIALSGKLLAEEDFISAIRARG